MKTELKNYLLKNEIKFCLVGKIKGLVEENKKTSLLFKNKKFAKGKGWILTRRKEILSNSTRYHLLAYAFLSGKAYKDIERKCEIAPDAKKIFKVVENNYQDWNLNQYKITEETISKWLES